MLHPRQPAILIRADASLRTGTGHVMRCLALAQAWQQLGGCATFLTASGMPAMVARLRARGVAVIELESEGGTVTDVRETMDLARELRAQWIAVDGYHFDTSYQRKLKEAGLHLLYVDDAGYAGAFFADVILNQNISATERLYANRQPYTKLLLGTRYALLRPEFSERSASSRQTAELAKNILVTLGGSDPDNATQRVMVSVLQLEGIEARIKVLVGVANPHLGALQRLTDRARAVEIICDADNMAEIMAWADLAVAAGGSTCWELAYMGLPMALVVLADNQRAIAVGLDREGAAINLGWHGSLNTEHTTTMLAALLRDAGRRHAMSRRGRDLVDGRGASRVVATLMENWI